MIQGNIDKAIADYTNASTIKPEIPEYYNNRGLAYYNSGQIDIALVDFNSALSRNPNYPAAYYNRGVAYFK